jgi:hypothetical protein
VIVEGHSDASAIVCPLLRLGAYRMRGPASIEPRCGLPGTFTIYSQGRTDRPQQYGAEPINRPSWMRPRQLDAALLPSLAITAESLLGPANGSLGLKPSGPFVFKHLIT